MNEQEENREIRRKIDQGVRLAIAEAVRQEKFVDFTEKDRNEAFKRALIRREEFLYLFNNLSEKIEKLSHNKVGLCLDQRAKHNSCFLLGFAALEAFLNFFSTDLIISKNLSEIDSKKLRSDRGSPKERIERTLKISEKYDTRDTRLSPKTVNFNNPVWESLDGLIELRNLLTHKNHHPVEGTLLNTMGFCKSLNEFYIWYVQQVIGKTNFRLTLFGTNRSFNITDLIDENLKTGMLN